MDIARNILYNCKSPLFSWLDMSFRHVTLLIDIVLWCAVLKRVKRQHKIESEILCVKRISILNLSEKFTDANNVLEHKKIGGSEKSLKWIMMS